MPYPIIPVWRKAPFLRLLIPLLGGIILQWYLPAALTVWLAVLAVALPVFFGFVFLPVFSRYRLSVLNGLALTAVFVASGALLIIKSDIRNDSSWFGRFYQRRQTLVVTILEDPVEKNKSFKAYASVDYFIEHGKRHPVTGKIILYLARDSFPGHISYGSRLIFNTQAQEIKNTGNPGSFDYKRYCFFQQITHQVYLKTADYQVLREKNSNWLWQFTAATKRHLLAVLRRYIPGEKEKGLAEALLIGYKNDLDKTLVQSYSNTGVVHIIAISGLHLGLIYWLLVQLLKPLRQRKYVRWLRPVIIICGLWIFSLLAGAQPSVLRSAVMFTCIIIGESIDRQTYIYNSLSVSAFLLLCYNPYWAWDAGFQLSYIAVLSIVIFMQPIYNWIYIKNKLLDLVWKMNTVTLAAQVLTLPVSVFHFHQFPNFFLLTNFVAVPLSSLILLGEILLCMIAFLPGPAFITGQVLHAMIKFMNAWVEKIEALPFSVWEGLQINICQVILLYGVIGFAGYWLLEKAKKGLVAGLLALCGFILLRSISFMEAWQQQKIIVYNIPGHRAVDIIEGNKYSFITDSSLIRDNAARDFHLKPSRILHRIAETAVDHYTINGGFLSCAGKKIALLDRKINLLPDTAAKMKIDLLILSGNPAIYLSTLASHFAIGQVVFDGSVPAWKSRYWKKDCDAMQVPWHDVSEKGAFVMNLR